MRSMHGLQAPELLSMKALGKTQCGTLEDFVHSGVAQQAVARMHKSNCSRGQLGVDVHFFQGLFEAGLRSIPGAL